MEISRSMLISGLLLTFIVCNGVEACFPSKYWISCLLNTCRFGGSCPGDPTAECRMERTKCYGCSAVWFRKNNKTEKADCSSKYNLELCPGGEPIVQCKVNACKLPCSHPDTKNATCRQSYCGRCAAEYLIKGKWMECPSSISPGVKSEQLPIDAVVSDKASTRCAYRKCPIGKCFGQKCRAHPRAVCRPDKCNKCRPVWLVDNVPVDCTTGEFLTKKPIKNRPLVNGSNGKSVQPWQRTCAKGQSIERCDMSVCDMRTCRNFPNAICRPDGCGGCKATWYVDDKLVECLSTDCPPRVAVVKCSVDPCKYFSHYCPSAECRPSQCGKCEAKFFSNGNEIDCVMPPKVCPAGVETRKCTWFTCPSNICPTNRRIMCRIDPCGKCDHEWVDIITSEISSCRLLDGPEKQPPKSTKRVFLRDPLARFFGPVPSGPLYVDVPVKTKPVYVEGNEIKNGIGIGPYPDKKLMNELTNGKSSTPEHLPHSTKKGDLNSNFLDPNAAVEDADLKAILEMFPHEVAALSTNSIQKILQKQNKEDIHQADKAIAKQIHMQTIDTTQKPYTNQPNVPSGKPLHRKQEHIFIPDPLPQKVINPKLEPVNMGLPVFQPDPKPPRTLTSKPEPVYTPKATPIMVTKPAVVKQKEKVKRKRFFIPPLRIHWE